MTWLVSVGAMSRLLLTPQVPPQLSGSFGTIMKWADEVRDMKVLSLTTLAWILSLDVVPSYDVLANDLDFKS